MKRISIIAVIILLFSVSTSSQNKSKDIQGWEETRWGMTSDEIGKALGSRAQKLTDFEGYGYGYYDEDSKPKNFIQKLLKGKTEKFNEELNS